MTYNRPNDDDSTDTRPDAIDSDRSNESAPDALHASTRLGAMQRRDYLRALGGVGAAGVLGSTVATTATAQSTFDEAAAEQRIRENQTGPLTVEVVDENGTPVTDATVDVEMQEHDFAFGNMVNADDLVNQFGDGHPYREHQLELFNTAVLENLHKWALWDSNTATADAAVDWLDQHGFDIRGHTCIYPVDYAIPGDVHDAVDSADGQHIRNRTLDHIEDIITHYGDKIAEWDVVNEVLHRGPLHSGVYPGQIDLDDLPSGEIQPWRSQLLADWYSQAESVIDQHGLDVEIATNDYNVLQWAYARERYSEQLTFLEEQGIDLDGIGLQSHIGPGNDTTDEWTYASLESGFENYTEFDANVRITEFDMAGDGWTGHDQRARVLERFLKTSYGHPDVDEFVMWGKWDDGNWQGEGVFFESDWSAKPTLDVYEGLVFDEWWTSESGSTGTDGTFGVDAFLGEYEVTVTTDTASRTVTTDVTNADGGRRLVVELDGDVGGTDPTDARAVNAGGEAHSTAGGETFVADEGYVAGSVHSTSDPIAGTEEGALYQTERYGESFAYEFALENGTYDVVLHFAETFHEADGERVFDVLVDGTTAISDLDIHAEVGHDAALTRTVEAVEVTDGTVTVAFEASVENAKVSAIQVTEAGDAPAESCGGVEGASSADVDGHTVCDLDGDGNYRDLTGSGDTTTQDLQFFFERQHRDPWNSRTDLFDYTGNGDVGQPDVVDLFHAI